MNAPVPDDSTLNGALHLLVDVVAGSVDQLTPDAAAALHAQIDAKFPASPVVPA
jgi:hypothetical protein